MRKGLTPDDLADFLALPLVAVPATYRRDGTVLLSPSGMSGAMQHPKPPWLPRFATRRG